MFYKVYYLDFEKSLIWESFIEHVCNGTVLCSRVKRGVRCKLYFLGAHIPVEEMENLSIVGRYEKRTLEIEDFLIFL